MNTPAHLMLNLGLLGRGQSTSQQLAVLTGALLPDLPMFVFYFWEKIWRGLPESVIWEQYFDPQWQMVFDLFHSFPVAILGGALSLWLKWKALSMFWASMVLHSLGDIFVHREDAHRHFYPVSNWQFVSPVSYWDPHFHGDVFSLVEILMVGIVGVWIWRGASWVGIKVIVASIFSMYFVYLGYVVLVWV